MHKSTVGCLLFASLTIATSGFSQQPAQFSFDTVTAVKINPGRFQVLGKNGESDQVSAWYSRIMNKPVTNEDCFRLAVIAYSNGHPFMIGKDTTDALVCTLGKEESK
jgi:hypothetical protein